MPQGAMAKHAHGGRAGQTRTPGVGWEWTNCASHSSSSHISTCLLRGLERPVGAEDLATVPYPRGGGGACKMSRRWPGSAVISSPPSTLHPAAWPQPGLSPGHRLLLMWTGTSFPGRVLGVLHPPCPALIGIWRGRGGQRRWGLLELGSGVSRWGQAWRSAACGRGPCAIHPVGVLARNREPVSGE